MEITLRGVKIYSGLNVNNSHFNRVGDFRKENPAVRFFHRRTLCRLDDDKCKDLRVSKKIEVRNSKHKCKFYIYIINCNRIYNIEKTSYIDRTTPQITYSSFDLLMTDTDNVAINFDPRILFISAFGYTMRRKYMTAHKLKFTAEDIAKMVTDFWDSLED